ncbi:MAG: T9SS type A sorting domain-containing protein [Bacteroidota bacterium]
MKSTRKYLTILALFFCALVSFNSFAANITSAAAGNWSATGTWVGGVVPGSADNVTIAHAVTGNITTSCTNLTVNTGVTFTISAGVTLTVSGNIALNTGSVIAGATADIIMNGATRTISGNTSAVINPSLTITGATSVIATITVNNLTINSGVTLTANAALSVAGNLECDGTLAGTNTVTLTGTKLLGGGISGTRGVISVSSFIIMSGAGTRTISGAADALGASFLSFTTAVTTATSSGAVTISAGADVTFSTNYASGTSSGLLTNNGTMAFTGAAGITINSSAGGLTNNGTMTFGTSGTPGTGALTMASSIDIVNTGTMTFYGTGTNITTGTFYTLSNSGTITLSGTYIGAQPNPSAINTTTGTITAAAVNLSATSAAFTNNGSFTITGNLSGSGTSTWTQGSSANAVLNIGGALTVNTLNASGAGNTVNYNGSGAQTIKLPSSSTYHHLTTNTGNTKTPTAGLTINGDLTIGASSTFAASTFTHNLKEDFINSGAFTAGTSTIIFNSSTVAQTLTGAATFYNLTMNNTFASGSLTLNSPVTVTNTLTMTSKNILTTSTNVLTLGSAASTTIGSASSYVDGPMVNTVATSTANTVRNFPIGRSTSYRPVVLTVTHSNATSVTYTAEVINSSATALGYTLPGTLTKVSDVRYWDVARQSVANFTNATIQIYYNTDDGVTDNLDLRVAKTIGAGTAWTDAGGTGTANTTGNITSGSFTSFSRFTLANNTGGTNPLPIELIYFDAITNGNNVDVSWKTASEINNDYFTVERSADGANFENIGIVDGAGNSTSILNYSLSDYRPYNGKSYYRLKQTDFNGMYTYSKVIAVEFNTANEFNFNVYPNPGASENLNLSITGNKSEEVLVVVYDISGKESYSKVIIVETDGENIYALDPSKKLSAGVYLITATSNQIICSKKLIVR